MPHRGAAEREGLIVLARDGALGGLREGRIEGRLGGRVERDEKLVHETD